MTLSPQFQMSVNDCRSRTGEIMRTREHRLGTACQGRTGSQFVGKGKGASVGMLQEGGRARVGPGLEQGWVSYHFGLEGWLHFPLLQQDPVDSLEKGMKSDVSGHSQPLDWLPLPNSCNPQGPRSGLKAMRNWSFCKLLADQGLQGRTGSVQELWG